MKTIEQLAAQAGFTMFKKLSHPPIECFEATAAQLSAFAALVEWENSMRFFGPGAHPPDSGLRDIVARDVFVESHRHYPTNEDAASAAFRAADSFLAARSRVAE